jgi:ABC-type dipeptide/oligopeptide/nickel transport system permease subunit
MSGAAQGKSLWSDARARLRRDPIGMCAFIVICVYLLIAFLCATHLAFKGYNVTNNALAYQEPNLQHWFGTDLFGRDVLDRAAHGTITSLTVGFFGAGLSVLIGTILGATAGYFGGFADELIGGLGTVIGIV